MVTTAHIPAPNRLRADRTERVPDSMQRVHSTPEPDSPPPTPTPVPEDEPEPIPVPVQEPEPHQVPIKTC